MVAGFSAIGCNQPTNKELEIVDKCQELKEYIFMDIDNDAHLGDVAESYIEILNEIIELNGYKAKNSSEAID